MRILVIYDITKTYKRNQIIKILQHYGFQRIQKSGFLGTLSLEKRIELEKVLEDRDYDENDSVYIFPVCNQCKSMVKIFAWDDRELEEDKTFKIV